MYNSQLTEKEHLMHGGRFLFSSSRIEKFLGAIEKEKEKSAALRQRSAV